MREGHQHDPLAEAMFYRSGFWIRIFGRGLWFSTYAGMPELFSERHGYTRVFRIGGWARWRWLRRSESSDAVEPQRLRLV